MEEKVRLLMETMTKDEQEGYVIEMKKVLETLSAEFNTQCSYVPRKVLNDYKLFQEPNYYKYILSKRIVDAVLSVSADAVVYGGYIRDNILHQHMSKSFYSRYSLFEDYNNPSVDTTTLFRTLVPNDIDILFVRQRDYDVFSLALKSLDMTFELDDVIPPYKTDDKVMTSRYKLKVFSDMNLQSLKKRPRLLNAEFANTYVMLDITVRCCQINASIKDFKCNSLRMNANGLINEIEHQGLFYESVDDMVLRQQKLFENFEDIKKQICNMESHCFYSHGTLSTPDIHRIELMFKKGFRFVIKHSDDELAQIIDRCDDCCAICRDDIVEIADVPGVHKLFNGLKFSCCSAVYHAKCLKTVFESPLLRSDWEHSRGYKCIQCRETIFEYMNDVTEWTYCFHRLDIIWNLVPEQ
jgi:hypothetical protein